MTNNPHIKGLKGILFVISAPSGAGKTSLTRALLKSLPGLHVSVSHTTRAPRPHEKPGADYHFVGEDEFQALVDQNRFLEHARIFDHRYGTSRTWVEEQLTDGKDIILEIDWQGARQVRKTMQDAVNVFILPPSLSALEKRLEGRGDEDEKIKRRMREAISEIEHYKEYDYLVVNDDFDKTLALLSAIFTAARHDYRLQRGYYEELVQELLRQGSNIR